MYQNILTETQGKIQIITINRPDKLNALNKETIAELHDAFAKAEAEPSCRAIVLTGSGEKAFVAGADIAEFASFSAQQGAELAAKGQKLLFDFIAHLETPVVAAINGYALGGGLELAMASHIRVASETAKMGLPEVSLGLIPGYGGTQRLTELVGKGKALEIIMTAGMIGAQESKDWGLVNHVVSPENLMEFAMNLAQKITKNSSTAISAAIRAVNANHQAKNGFITEINEFGKCFDTDDFTEGTTAFLEKRKPNF